MPTFDEPLNAESGSPQRVSPAEDEESDKKVRSSFFALGAASDITFNGILLSVAYLQSQCGNNVLVKIGQAQFIASFGIMTTLFVWGFLQPATTGGKNPGSLKLLVWTLLSSMTYMVILLCWLCFCAGSGTHLDARLLQGGMLLNGAATGAVQNRVGSLAGLMTTFGGHPMAASSQMSGVGLGIALPTMVQLLCMPFQFEASHVAFLCYSVAAVFTLYGLISLSKLRQTDAFQRCERGGIDEMAKSPGLSGVIQSNWQRWTKLRFRQVFFPSFGLLVGFSMMVYSGLLTPHMPSKGAWPLPEQLPTLLLSTTNACDFLGRIAAAKALTRVSLLSSLPFLMFMVLCRVGLLLCVVMYCREPPDWVTSNAPIVGLYALSAILTGGVGVCFTQFAQTICMRTSGRNNDQVSQLPCPIASQIMWLATVLGSAIGAMLMPVFLPMP